MEFNQYVRVANISVDKPSNQMKHKGYVPKAMKQILP